ncbi:MAG: hypothetical protein IT204_09385 [Fimbriimonadaceae bacterium]|nr:hypothetical protein [Fimbriimonadaceae bacterium]
MRLLAGLLLLVVRLPALELAPGLPALPQPGVPLLWANLPDADLQQPAPTLAPPQPYQWVGDPDRATTLRVELPAAVTRAVLTAWDCENRPVAQQPLPGGSSSLPLQLRGQGVWLLTLDCWRGEQLTARLARSVAALASAKEARARWAQDEFWVGTCAFPGRQHWTNAYGPGRPVGLTAAQARELDAELAARSGVTVVRPDVPVRWSGPTAAIDWSACDEAFGAWTAQGCRLFLQLCQPPEWAVLPAYAQVPDPRWRYPRQEDPTRRLLRELLPRYGPQAVAVELYNEPDNRDFWRGTPGEFGELLAWTLDELRRGAPQVLVGSPGYCLIEPTWCGQFARTLRGQVGLIDYHSHGDLGNLLWAERAILATHAAAEQPVRPLCNTEMGYAAWRLDQERMQGVTGLQKLLYCWAHGHRGALLYASREIGGPRQKLGDPDFGFVDHFFCPRFAYGGLTALVNLLAGARCEQVLRQTPGQHVYLFRRGPDRLLATFAENLQESRLTVRTEAREVVVYDPFGNPAPPVAGGSVELPCGAWPRVTLLRAAAAPTLP